MQHVCTWITWFFFLHFFYILGVSLRSYKILRWMVHFLTLSCDWHYSECVRSRWCWLALILCVFISLVIGFSWACLFILLQSACYAQHLCRALYSHRKWKRMISDFKSYILKKLNIVFSCFLNYLFWDLGY